MAFKFSITNGCLELSANSKGAELSSVKNRKHNYEFIWQANADVWNRHAPILFPIVGKLNNNQTEIDGNYYSMSQHGFARDCNFEMIDQSTNELSFKLLASPETRVLYPFDFELIVTYSFTDIANQIKVTYHVNNLSDKAMPFSIGAHPGFQLPVKDLSQYEIDFYTIDSFQKELLSNGLFAEKAEEVKLKNSKLTLQADSFSKDAIVIKDIVAKKIKLNHLHSDFAIEMAFNDFTDLGIWSKTNCQEFICLEPWLGYADNVGYTGNMYNKKGIVLLESSQSYTASYFMSFSI
ncbi:MAG: aldose 1-epimerase family protein [Bacteroidota bacterium]